MLTHKFVFLSVYIQSVYIEHSKITTDYAIELL